MAAVVARAFASWKVVFLLYALLIALATRDAIRHPAFNFDVLGYAGAAIAKRAPDARAVHDRVYGAVSQVASERQRTELTLASAYRRALSESPEKFALQLPLYANKVGYVQLTAVVGRTDAGVVRATYLVSAGAYAVLAGLVFFWVSRYLTPLRSLVLASGLMLSPPLLASARLSTPDLLCALLLVLGSFLALEIGAAAWAAVAFAFACVVRPDALLASLVVLYVAASTDVTLRWPKRAVEAAAPVIGAAISASQGYGWAVIMRHTFVERILAPANAARGIGAFEYAGALVSGLFGNQTDGFSNLPTQAVFVVAALGIATTARSAPCRKLLWAAGASMASHYVLFPMLSDRFFLHGYVLIAVALACALGGR